MGDDIRQAIQYFMNLQIFLGIEKLFVIVHKSPYTWSQCLQVKESWTELQNSYRWITFYNVADAIVSYASNLFFNAADIGEEIYWILIYYVFEDYEGIGKMIAKLTSDIFINSPFRNSFNYRNSQFIKYRIYRENIGDNADQVQGRLQSSLDDKNSQYSGDLDQKYKIKLRQKITEETLEYMIDALNNCVQNKKFQNMSIREEFLDKAEELIQTSTLSSKNNEQKQKFYDEINLILFNYC
ncbi:UNKNOWN [Stylonychia lemnae]|uniref:Uncharacterized protein n=1 Tax=Stylonychia lemnae TaxID=5949 RepID=A0A078AH34_STYLE|nr:UNKNOWN [Stylonychia lemnae]|eukprot:CDW81141.1 UNKNOWN [Stylonychia lemnae]